MVLKSSLAIDIKNKMFGSCNGQNFRHNHTIHARKLRVVVLGEKSCQFTDECV